MKISNQWAKKNGQWLFDQRLPVYIHEDAEVHVWGRWFFTRDAFLPGFGCGRFLRLAEKFPVCRPWLERCDRRIYMKGGSWHGEPRTMPLVWRFRDRPPAEAFGQPVYANTTTKLVRVPEGTPPPSGPGWQQAGYTEGQDEAFDEWVPLRVWVAPKDTPLPSLEGWGLVGWTPDDLPGPDTDFQED